jgi:hypothetical protein
MGASISVSVKNGSTTGTGRFPASAFRGSGSAPD